MKMEINRPQLNEEQKKAAFCGENAVVAAGAGSGKTFVLASRFAWLLTEKGYKVDEILTLTFTKKAASQMYSRIYALISEIAETENGEKAQKAKTALDDFIHARIQTLDSYCASIARQCALRYGISPDFQIDKERCYNIALEVSYPFLIANRHHPAVERLYSHNRPNDIVRDIFADVLYNYCLIDKPRDFLSDVKIQFSSLRIEWENYNNKINSIIREIEHDITEDYNFLPVLAPIMENYKKNRIEMPGTREINEYLDLILNIPLDLVIEKSESHPLIKKIIKYMFFLNSVSSVSLKGGKKSENPVKKNINLLREMTSAVSSLAVSCIQAGLICSVMSLFYELQKHYLAKKRAEGVLTFKDVASLSRTILAEQNDIRQSEKETFKAIMIDEFQDNNELQKDILFILAEKNGINGKGVPSYDDLCPGKLFFVGDEKQSVYLFRGADVSVFRRLKNEIKSRDLPLKINYRSSPDLIGAFNAIFGGCGFDSGGKAALHDFNSVFAPPDHLPLYEAGYTALESSGKCGEKTIHRGLSLCILNKDNIPENENKETLLSSDESEAGFVAEKIKTLLSRNYQPDDIAVLFRTRSHLYLYEKHLRSLGIPYTCEDINDLFYGGPVNDIMSVLRLAAHPMDKAAYAEMLRSPFAGLSIPGTAVCLSFVCGESGKHEPFDDFPIQCLEETDRAKYICGQKIYSSIRKKSETENISSLISELWYNEGYRYETEWNPQTGVYRELYDYLFHLASNADADNQELSSFTDSMISLRNSGGQLKDAEIPLEHSGAVHLMTIHKSKGLEFPVVFLCSCGNWGQSDKCETVYFSEKAGIVFSPPPPPEYRSISEKQCNFFWEQASGDIKQKKTAELRRLLYVGMTRAENELYITGSLNIKNEDGIDDFSVLLKKYSEKKCKKNDNYIEGDSIINNNTFFGLLLPAITAHIPDDGLAAGSSFFNIEEIKHLPQNYLKSDETSVSGARSGDQKLRKNNKKSLKEFINNINPFYENAEIIKTPFLKDNHLTPVQLKKITGDFYEEDTDDWQPEKNVRSRRHNINNEYSGIKSDDIFNKVDSILQRFSQNSEENTEKFNSGSFGTIAHICVEAHLNKEEPAIPSNISCLLTPSQMSTLLEAGKELAERFIISPLGKIAESAGLRESEFSFRSLIKNNEGGEIFINGTVDLFFEDAETIHIVDFKTDSVEKPNEHTAQMACYFCAISSLFADPLKKQCRIWLYYLRTGHAVEMTEKVIKYNLEQKTLLML